MFVNQDSSSRLKITQTWSLSKYWGLGFANIPNFIVEKIFERSHWWLPPKAIQSLFYTLLSLQIIGILNNKCLLIVIWQKSGTQVFLCPPLYGIGLRRSVAQPRSNFLIIMVGYYVTLLKIILCVIWSFYFCHKKKFIVE